ncbi:unnamed protein product [Toxocara canis]|uniref:Uncharacterized protein n=1 Tax=Toxocara canis TaxID=6265 RepID=A0A183VA65_TOXCA|nr:unnamed protein product [Toxocara canis]
MSNFLRMFRSKKVDKENQPPVEEDSNTFRRVPSHGNIRRDKRSSRFVSVDDTFLKPTAPYHTVTQPKQTKGSRSCVGRDEYDRFRIEPPLRERNGSRYGKRTYGASEFGRDTSSSMNLNTYDPELGDSDDSFDSVRRSRTLKNEDAIQTLEMKVETLLYRLRKEEDKKNSYKQKLMSERIVRQHVEAKFVEDIQRLTRLVETLKNEQKTYRNKIGMLETQLKETHAERGAREPHHFTGSSLFNSPPSTSNEQSSLNGAGEMLCTASGSTLPIHSAVASFQPFNNNDDVDEVKNFRINEVYIVREMHSTLEIARCSKIDSSSSMSQNHENTLDPTVLEDDTSTTGTVESAATMAGDEVRRKRGKTYLRRSLSDTDVRAFRVRGSRTQMTNL